MDFPYVDSAVKEIKACFPVSKHKDMVNVGCVSSNFISANEDGGLYYSSNGKDWNPLTMMSELNSIMNKQE